MNKKEQQHVADLQAEIRLLRAMHVTPPVLPDIDNSALAWHEHATGYLYSLVSERVIAAITQRKAHGYGHDLDTARWAQGGVMLYTTRKRALMALRAALSHNYAQTLADLDKQIEEEQD